MTLSLILGGARSGKSDLAERLAAASSGSVLFVATLEPRDDEMRERVEAHRLGRREGWRVVEEPVDLVGALKASAAPGDFIVIDCITLWASNLLLARLWNLDEVKPAEARDAMDAIAQEVDNLVEWCMASDHEIAVVSNEVGMGLVPPYPAGRLFRDVLGGANRALAAPADRVYCLMAGLVLEMKALGALPLDGFGESAGR